MEGIGTETSYWEVDEVVSMSDCLSEPSQNSALESSSEMNKQIHNSQSSNHTHNERQGHGMFLSHPFCCSGEDSATQWLIPQRHPFPFH